MSIYILAIMVDMHASSDFFWIFSWNGHLAREHSGVC